MIESVSPGISRFIDGLSEGESEGLNAVLRDSNSNLVEEMDDVLAILNQIKVCIRVNSAGTFHGR